MKKGAFSAVVLTALVLVSLFGASPVNAAPSLTIGSYTPTSTISTPYPKISAVIHMSDANLLLNLTTMSLDGSLVNYTTSYANLILVNRTIMSSDVAVWYFAQSYLPEGVHTVTVIAKYYEPSTVITMLSKSATWSFAIKYDPFVKAALRANATVQSVNQTLVALQSELNAFGVKLETYSRTLNSTAQYLNTTIGNIQNLVQSYLNMFSCPSGNLCWLSTVRSSIWILEVYGGLVLAMLLGIAVLLVLVLRKESTTASTPYLVPASSSTGTKKDDPAGETIVQPTTQLDVKDGPKCPQCLKPNRAGAKFCYNCQTPLGETKA